MHHRYYIAIVLISIASFLVLFIFFAATFLPDANRKTPKSDNPKESRQVGTYGAGLNLKSEISSPQVNFTDPARGKKDAPNTLVVYGDFLCHYTKSAVAILKKLTDDHPGRIKVVWKDFPVHSGNPFDTLASQAAHCAKEQGEFWPYHDLIFENQNQISPSFLLALADKVGLDKGKFLNCLQTEKTKPKVTSNLNETRALGLDGTPTLFLNGTRYDGKISYENLEMMMK